MGSLESFSNDYGSGSALKISDAELTGFDLKIKENAAEVGEQLLVCRNTRVWV